MQGKTQKNLELKTSTVQYASRASRKKGMLNVVAEYSTFPRISIAGLWLEELGVHIGDKLQVECSAGCLKISLADTKMVCEENVNYEASGDGSDGIKRSRRKKEAQA